MNRRKFLTILGSAGVVSALGTAQVAKASGGTTTYPYYENSYGVLHDTTRCIGCRRCEKACQQVNNLPMPAKPFNDLEVTATKRRTTADAWTVVNRYMIKNPEGGKDKPVFRKLQCYHCNDPACASACFAKCFKKEPSGVVSYDGSQCVGCRYCMVACPFYVPGFQYEEAWDPLVLKCTFCSPRLQKGQLPGCVEACPMGALTFGKRSDLIKIARKRMDKEPAKYVDYLYGEYDAGGTAWMTLSGVPHAELGMDMNLGNRPMGELTAGALGAVPMIIAFWPVLFGGVYGITKCKERLVKKEQEKAIAAAQAQTKQALEAAVENIEKTQGVEAAIQVRQALKTAQQPPSDGSCCCSSKHGEGV